MCVCVWLVLTTAEVLHACSRGSFVSASAWSIIVSYRCHGSSKHSTEESNRSVYLADQTTLIASFLGAHEAKGLGINSLFETKRSERFLQNIVPVVSSCSLRVNLTGHIA